MPLWWVFVCVCRILIMNDVDYGSIYRQLGRSIEVEVDIDDVEPPATYDGDLD